MNEQAVAREILSVTRDLMAAEGDKCGPSGCIKEVKGGWGIMSGKTGKMWPQTYKTREDAEDALKRYHGWGFKKSSTTAREMTAYDTPMEGEARIAAVIAARVPSHVERDAERAFKQHLRRHPEVMDQYDDVFDFVFDEIATQTDDVDDIHDWAEDVALRLHKKYMKSRRASQRTAKSKNLRTKVVDNHGEEFSASIVDEARIAGITRKIVAESTIDAIVKFFDYLEGRWSDESEYEDFSEYEDAARKKVQSQGFKFVSLSDSPMKLKFKDKAAEYTVSIKGSRIVLDTKS